MVAKPIDVQKLTQRKVTIPLIMVVGILILGWRADGITVDYLDDFFILKSEASEQFEKISEQVKQNSELIIQHVGEYKLNENAKAMSRIQDALFELKFHVTENGESNLTRERKRSLDSQLARLGRVRACIVSNQHISDDEPTTNCDAIQ